MSKEINSMTIDEVSKKTPVFGIVSIVCGGVSLMPFVGIISPIGLLFGIIALVKKQKITGIIGTCLSIVGIATSPLLWASVLSATCAVIPMEACTQQTEVISEEQVDEVVVPDANDVVVPTEVPPAQ